MEQPQHSRQCRAEVACETDAPKLDTPVEQQPEPIHRPVMCERVVALLSPALSEPGAVIVDCTVGMGGHATALLAANPHAKLIGIDRDCDALELAEQALAPQFEDRVNLVQARFDEVGDVLAKLHLPCVHAVFADLGLSSLQIDRAERGFAYSKDAPLDMRMDRRNEFTAADVVNTYSAAELTAVLRRYGEEPHAARIAKAIVKHRELAAITSSAQLVDVISAALPASVRFGSGHLAKRTFQGLRIEVNGELDALAGLLPVGLDRLAVTGRMAVLSYHSLEDRMVKQTFAHATSDAVPRRLPVVPDERKARFTSLTRGAEKPNPAEIEQNPRAASARLRAVERSLPGSLASHEQQLPSRRPSREERQ